MSDGRSQRKSNVVQFLTKIDSDRLLNYEELVRKAKQFQLEGFNNSEWDKDVWTITSGRLLIQSGKNINSLTINFNYAPKLGGGAIGEGWSDLIKSLVVLRFHRSLQSAANQRTFITALGYVAFELDRRKIPAYNLTREYLNFACEKISKDFSEGVAYNLHKAVGEFAAHCDSNGLCNTYLDFKYAGMKRPINTGGIGHKRLDDPNTLETTNEKVLEPKVFKIIGELYLNVPKDHKYRLYVLILSILALLGRRFSEVSLLPNQTLSRDQDGRAYLNYFPRKQSKGDVNTPLKRLYIPTQTIEILESIIDEVAALCDSARKTALEMHVNNGPDLNRFLHIDENKKFYKQDLALLGLPENLLETVGWIRKNGFAFEGEYLNTTNKKANKPWYTNLRGIIAYCEKDFQPNSLLPIHIDQKGNKYYLKDMLLVRRLGLSTGYYAFWLSTICTHSMMTTFLRYFTELSKEFASSALEVNFTSHHFRHTLNTLLDEGGLSDLLQTEWFGRTNQNDTKAYQHTSREKKALMLRADIKDGKINGRLPDKIKSLPTSIQDAVLAARIHAVHDVGPGMCIHNFIQSSCERHLQCSADCDDYVWAKNDVGRLDELKRMYVITVINRRTAEERSQGPKPKKSIDWIEHNDKKLKVLSKQLKDYGVDEFDVDAYLKEHEIGH